MSSYWPAGARCFPVAKMTDEKVKERGLSTTLGSINSYCALVLL